MSASETSLARLSQHVSLAIAALADAADAGPSLGALDPGSMPPATAAHWGEIARLLKSDPRKSIPARALAVLPSWPQARRAALIEHLTALRTLIDRLENERLEDDVRDGIRHHYL